MYKGKRYNALVVCLLFIISIVVGFSAGMSRSNDASPESGWEEELPDDLTPEVEENTNPVTNGVPGADANAYERLAFAMKYINEGSGYTSYLYQNLNTAGNNQFMAIKKYRGGGLDFTEEWFKFDAIMAILASLGVHEFRSYYSDGTNMKYKLIENTKNFNFDEKKYDYTAEYKLTEFTAQYYQTVYNRTKLNNFYTTVNERTSTLERYDKKTDPDNYIIKVKIDQSKLDPQYISTFLSNGATNLNIKTHIITFKISKKTGFITSYEKYEVFSATQGITLDFVLNLKETYLTMNRSAESTIKDIVSKSFGVKF